MHFYKSLLGLIVTFYGTAALVTPEIKSRGVLSSTDRSSTMAEYGANPVSWNQDLYDSALQWAQQCQFQHSNPGVAYGENIAAGGQPGVPSQFTFANAMAGFMSEAPEYYYNNPGFSEETGHFTQIVWKATTGVACAMATCPADTIFPFEANLYVCRYTPPGNFAGQFAQNVGMDV